jgi:hypothetical protein
MWSRRGRGSREFRSGKESSLEAETIGGLAGRLSLRPVVGYVRDRIDDDYVPRSVVRIFRALCGGQMLGATVCQRQPARAGIAADTFSVALGMKCPVQGKLSGSMRSWPLGHIVLISDTLFLQISRSLRFHINCPVSRTKQEIAIQPRCCRL